MDKKLFDNFLSKFRVSSNLRAGFLPPNIDDYGFPFRIYIGAFNEAKEELMKENDYTEDQMRIIDEAFDVFMTDLKESKNYNVAEKAMIEHMENKLKVNK